MPIVNHIVKPFVQPPYRGKVVEGGGIRNHDDWRYVTLNETDEYGSRLVVHDYSSSGEVVFEIHNAWSESGEEELENCRMECFQLNKEQRMELAIYLLSTV
jgi:hypothetical protein